MVKFHNSVGAGQLTPAWFPLRYHQDQAEVWKSRVRFKALACGRGSGKTEVARRYLVRMLPVRKRWSDPIYVFAGPTYNQVRRVAWIKILDLIPKSWIENINVNSLVIKTIFGSYLYVVGLDQPQRVEGSQYDGIVIDESSDIKPGVFDRSVLPALSHRNGFCWRIGVPKRFGVGAAEYKAFFDKGMSGTHEDIKSWSWMSKDILTEKEIEMARKVLTESDFREQYEASWESIGGCIFDAFSKVENVKEGIEYDPNLPILVGSDFNVNPMCWCLAQRHGNTLHFFDELFIRNTNTQKTLNELYLKFHEHTAGWEFYGDAAGRQRRTAAVTTDYIQIRNDPRFHPKQIFYPKSNPIILNRFAACNALLRNAAGDVRCFINPRCDKLILDLQSRAYKEGTRIPDDSFDIGHMSDAFGYMIYKLFPVRGEMFSSDLPRSRVITVAG